MVHCQLTVLTVVYVQITLLWRYFTLEITLGYKYELKSILAISNSQASFNINLKSWAEIK